MYYERSDDDVACVGVTMPKPAGVPGVFEGSGPSLTWGYRTTRDVQ